MAIDSKKVSSYLAAGYTHYVMYESWLPICEMWVTAGFPTTSDAVQIHQDSCARRVEAGEIRYPSIIALK